VSCAETAGVSILGAINRRVGRSVNWNSFGGLKVIGMDEIAVRKGSCDFVVIVTLRGADNVKVGSYVSRLIPYLVFRKILSRIPIIPIKTAMAAKLFKGEFACAHDIASPRQTRIAAILKK
jgi:hypothetical protein